MRALRKLIHDFRWRLVKGLNIIVWAIAPEPERSELRQSWRAQFDNFKKQDGGAHLAEMVLRQAEHSSELGRLAAEWERQQNHYPEHEPAQAEMERIKQKNRLRENFKRHRNVIRWPK